MLMLEQQWQRLSRPRQYADRPGPPGPIGSLSPRTARISAIRLIVAINQMASPAAALATMVFNPSAESKLNTSFPARARSARSAARAVSASKMAADRILANRGHGIIPTRSLSA
jgi:hypothetical protein